MDPPSLLAVADQARVAQGPQMEGQERLPDVQRAGQVAHTALAGPKNLEDPQSFQIRERVKNALQAGVGDSVLSDHKYQYN